MQKCLITTLSRSNSEGRRSSVHLSKQPKWRSDMTTAAPEPGANMGQPVPRYDARLKVTGAARYPSDMPVNNPAYAFLVTSSIAKGRILEMDLDDARRIPGVLEIFARNNTAD